MRDQIPPAVITGQFMDPPWVWAFTRPPFYAAMLWPYHGLTLQ